MSDDRRFASSYTERLKEDPIRIVEFAAIAVAAVYMTWANASKVPALEGKVATQDTRLTVLESKVDDIRSDVKTIRWAVTGRGRREQP